MVISHKWLGEKNFFCQFPIHLTLDIKKSPPFCPFQFVRVSQSFQLDVHRPSDVLIEPVHEDKKLIKCSICDYTCPQEGDLTNHIASVHNGNYKIIPGCTKNAKVYQLDGFLYRVSSKRPRKGPTEKIYLICQEREETVEGKKVL